MSIGFGRGELLQVPRWNHSSSSESSLAVTSRSDSDPQDSPEPSGSISDNPDAHNPDTELPLLEFRINYFTATETLNVTVVQVRNIPTQFRKNCSSYVKLSLKAFNKLKTKRYKTKTIRNSLNPIFDEEFAFVNYTFDELKNFRLRFSCYAKSRKLSKKILVGDLFVPLARPDFEPHSLLSKRITRLIGLIK